jgi:superfamily II DNA or RNA helicase
MNNKIEQTNGYIYIRNHSAYDIENACKMGKASNIPERDSVYATGEIKRGWFNPVFEVPYELMSNIEHQLQIKFSEFNIRYDAGTEYYNKKIISHIEPYLIKNKIKYRKLTDEEINELVRLNRNKNTNHVTIKEKYIKRQDQINIIQKSVVHLKNYNKGLLVLMCGVGKTLISLWIAQELKANTILIGVPNKLLLNQWVEKFKELFPNVNYLIVSGGKNVNDIVTFLNNNNKKCIIITTYSSSHKVLTATRQINFTFNYQINDECHHLTSNNINEEERKTFVNMLKINSDKQLSLTATLKILENIENQREDEIIVANDNIEYFGEIIDQKCLLWAINNNIICDYSIQTIVANEEQLEQQFIKFHIIEENDKRLFLSSFAALKSIFERHSHHLLIYANNKDNAIKLKQYIKMLLDDEYFNIPSLYCSDYHSEMNTTQQNEIENKFKSADFGIISCVYCLGEGWDCPLLDGVVFAENMCSNIRILQSALRPGRKNAAEPNKKTKIILPILNRDDWFEDGENQDLKKVRDIIYQMGLEDETITQKIGVFKINVEPNPNPKPKPSGLIIYEFGEYDDILTQRLKLKTVSRTALATSFEKAKKIIADKNIMSIEEYYELCDKNNRLVKDPETVYKGKFTNWIDYLSIKRVYYDFETCKNKTNEYLSLNPEIKKCLEISDVACELCKIDNNFPPYRLWCEYYDIKDLRELITITNTKKKISAVL